jgi:hypothetical protein
MAVHPDTISKASVELLDDDVTVILEMTCSSPDLAEVLYDMLGSQLKAGRINLQGRNGRATGEVCQ